MRLSQQISSQRHIPTAKLARKDYISAQLIEIGIVIQALQGTHEAASYLRSKRVDVDVARRVLTQPQLRRTWASFTYSSTPPANS